MNIIDYAISHARVFFSILIFIIATGSYTYISIPKEAAPDVNIPIIYVSLSQKGISPNDSERLLVKPIEDEVKTVEGIKHKNEKCIAVQFHPEASPGPYDCKFVFDQLKKIIEGKIDAY